jgi:hypothetical protein
MWSSDVWRNKGVALCSSAHGSHFVLLGCDIVRTFTPSLDLAQVRCAPIYPVCKVCVANSPTWYPLGWKKVLVVEVCFLST